MTAPGGVAVLLPDKQRLTGLSPEQIRLLKALGREPALLDPADTRVSPLLDRLLTAGLLTVTVRSGGVDLYSLLPFAPPPARTAPEAGRVPITLSKFAVIHRIDDRCVAEHPMSWCDIEIHDGRVLAAIGGLSATGELSADALSRLADDLGWAGFVTDPRSEHDDFATRSWGPHELWFHRRSTFGVRTRDWGRFGPTKWAAGTFPPLPARKTAYATEPIALPAPDLDSLRVAGDSLTTAIEDRTSCRDFVAQSPPSVDQLGEFLFRTARNRTLRVIGDEEFPSRPFPSGGGLYEMEVYPVVRQVHGLAPGMYHYDAFDHALRPVAAIDHPAISRLLTPSSLTLADGQLPQILFVFAARVGRVMWTYEQIPYAVMLKHVGVLTQTMSLVATDMGLGSVAQGYCDTAAFAELAGVDEMTECAMGSLVLGSPRR
ncbi:SagB family peptide dehydrogenase [Williamsia muralis]|uniref:SagB family peptide dehydrogenase n=1 Tax=Williamsia marianensis TaxID=85044 RepID=UPI003F163921